MVDDSPEDTTLSPDSGRAKRAPPTIDLEAIEVSGETQAMPPPARSRSDHCSGFGRLRFPRRSFRRLPAPALPRW